VARSSLDHDLVAVWDGDPLDGPEARALMSEVSTLLYVHLDMSGNAV
jgi:hypothetical protein